jgi:hypothetical protein
MTEREAATLEGFQAGYVEIAGLPTWHEVRGEGPAVVLLHGALRLLDVDGFHGVSLTHWRVFGIYLCDTPGAGNVTGQWP